MKKHMKKYKLTSQRTCYAGNEIRNNENNKTYQNFNANDCIENYDIILKITEEMFNDDIELSKSNNLNIGDEINTIKSVTFINCENSGNNLEVDVWDLDPFYKVDIFNGSEYEILYQHECGKLIKNISK